MDSWTLLMVALGCSMLWDTLMQDMEFSIYVLSAPLGLTGAVTVTKACC